ncbi:Ras GTPase [Tieghemostelium lacteum]|uniref:small monomeric GTPase n=1 Tax=Tieghemostelium lacteum TaxID=361077 RepID=A0A151ZS21_TIELA|nr:Ras GTPase [Tieghemostelium lacteum]|eukprot:KYQ96777.1 Ras GTPase [Tieghemostelium lacteum]
MTSETSTTTTNNNNTVKRNSATNNVYKIAILGDGGVGKTSLTIQYISNHFVEYYDPTIEDSYRKQCVIDEVASILDILDTAGQEELSAMRDQWIRSCESFIIVYSVTSRTSFDQVALFKEQISRVLDRDQVPMMLVGNKCDLESQRQVSLEEGQDLAKCLGMLHIESSSKSRYNVEEAFIGLVREMRRREKSLKEPKSDGSTKDKLKSMLKSKMHKINKMKNQKLQSVCKMQ